MRNKKGKGDPGDGPIAPSLRRMRIKKERITVALSKQMIKSKGKSDPGDDYIAPSLRRIRNKIIKERATVGGCHRSFLTRCKINGRKRERNNEE